MAELVYGLCALTSAGCAALLFQGYRRSGTRLLFWSSLCFAGLALNNALLFVDLGARSGDRSPVAPQRRRTLGNQCAHLRPDLGVPVNADFLNSVLLGALTMSAGVIGLLFLRFWRVSRERLFAFFALSFWLLGLNWLALAVVRVSSEKQHQIYLVRLIAFGLDHRGNHRQESKSPDRVSGSKPGGAAIGDGVRGSSRAS